MSTPGNRRIGFWRTIWIQFQLAIGVRPKLRTTDFKVTRVLYPDTGKRYVYIEFPDATLTLSLDKGQARHLGERLQKLANELDILE